MQKGHWRKRKENIGVLPMRAPEVRWLGSMAFCGTARGIGCYLDGEGEGH